MRIVSVWIFLFVSMPGWAADYGSQRNVEAARAVWESAINAKGGRPLLRNVRSLGVQSHSKSSKGVRRFQSYSREVFDFPSRIWIRAEDAPYQGSVGSILILQAWDAEKGTGWYTNGEALPKARDSATTTRVVREKTCKAIEFYLLESEQYQPEIVAVDESKWSNKDALVVYLNSCSGPAAYVVDPSTRLPLAFIIFPIRRFEEKLPSLPTSYRYGVWFLSDYVSVDGIMMPRQTSSGETTYEFNRKYPRSLFAEPPKVSDWGPWPPPTRR